MKSLILICALLLTGCTTTMADLSPPKTNLYFEIDKDIEIRKSYGMMAGDWIYQFKKGKYILVGESSDGMYFLGEPKSIIVIQGPNVDIYNETGEVNSLGAPGVWIAKNKSIPSKIFYQVGSFFYPNVGEVNGDSINATNGNSQVGGLATYVIASALDGSLFLVETKEPLAFIQDFELKEYGN